MKRKPLIVIITFIILAVGITAAFAYGKTNAANTGSQSYFDSLNDYDWSKACPAAGCRNNNEAE